MSPCVGGMGTPLYPHFESRQMLSPVPQTSVYIQHDTVGDYNSGTCSVFAGLGSPFDPSAPYGVVAPQMVAPQMVAPQMVAPQMVAPQMVAPQMVVPQVVAPQVVDPQMVASQMVAPQVVAPQMVAPQVVAPQMVAPQVVAPQVLAPQMVVASQVVAPQIQPQVPPPQAPPEAYNSLSKFTNTSSLVATSFPYSGAVAPPAVPSGPVSCSYAQNTFCMAGLHDGAAPTAVFGQYPDPSSSAQSLYNGGVNDCADFQPNFEALSSPSPASADKSSRYLAAPSMAMPGKTCADYPVQSVATSATDCSGRVEDGYEMDIPASPTPLAAEDVGRPESCFPAYSAASAAHRGFDASLLSSSSADSGIAASSGEPGEAAESLGEIVKKSMVETVSA
ncbi:hypothetical protein GWK47_040467 [Chionoecetes opilio]|uniref:Uncharacterized protein n=1 Tax=Chionoecetes opilio TaxID=41210 RepID=A0A8J4YAP9_CHIOP|nr:hypothetical protein GWK47_040467 [Chionoecetes opilio]